MGGQGCRCSNLLMICYPSACVHYMPLGRISDGSTHVGLGPCQQMVLPSRFSPFRRMVLPTSMKTALLLKSATVDSAHDNNRFLSSGILRIVVSAHSLIQNFFLL